MSGAALDAALRCWVCAAGRGAVIVCGVLDRTGAMSGVAVALHSVMGMRCGGVEGGQRPEISPWALQAYRSGLRCPQEPR
jgi:hypothetical protein